MLGSFLSIPIFCLICNISMSDNGGIAYEVIMQLSHRLAITISGLVWFAIGLLLMIKGMGFLNEALAMHASGGLLSKLVPIAGSREQAGVLMVAVALLIGFIKGRVVLAKTVKRTVERILSLPQPLEWRRLYGARYYVLISIMMALGLSMKWFGLPIDIRGGIDVAIGSALMNGALLYFRYAMAMRKAKS